jgi:hypothetical protein
MSVIQSPFTYGNNLYEMAVLDRNGSICYTTIITNDVLGYLSTEEVTDYMNRINNLIPYISVVDIFAIADTP